MPIETIQFFVEGKPATAGSKQPYLYAGKDGKQHAAMAPANKRQKPWMSHVASTARDSYKGPVLKCPIQMTIDFIFFRPKSHFGTGRNSDVLKPSAPIYHIIKPDAIKLARAIEDALTGIIWHDDSQVFDTHPVKRYDSGWGRQGALVTILCHKDG